MAVTAAVFVFSMTFLTQEGSEDSRFRGVGRILELDDARVVNFYRKPNSEFVYICLAWRKRVYWVSVHINSARLQLRTEHRYVGLSGTVDVLDRICKNAVIFAPRISYYLIRRQIAEFRRGGGR